MIFLNMKKVSFLFIATLFLASCGSEPKEQTKALTSFDACSCATAKDANSDDFKKCKELRAADPTFESAFQKCLLANTSGLDTNQVKLVASDKIARAGAGRYSLLSEGSSLRWRGQKATGKMHEGTIQVKSGYLELEGETIKGGEIVLNMTSISNTDLTGEGKNKLENHLKSDDFFAVQKFPEAKFVIKSAETKSNVQYDVVGDLTIKGKTQETKSSLIITPNGADGANIGGSIIFDRSLFDVRYGSDKFFDKLGDDLIKNEVIITFDLKSKK